MTPTSGATDSLVARLTAVVGAAHCRVDEPTRRLYSQDVYRAGELTAAVVSPGTTTEVAELVRLANELGFDLQVRGGGMSYTDGYLPSNQKTWVVDLSRLNRIREINATDLYATVEAGCTWAQLDAALSSQGLRAIFWGPMSGKLATVGGGMSQGAATFGSGLHGISAGAALAFEVVLGTGDVLTTGSAAQAGHSPFFRHYGPDLTGLFTGDVGAFGIKTAVTLQLERRPAHGTGLSFSFERFADMATALQALAQQRIATEVFGAETALLRSIAGPANFRQDANTALTVLRSARNPLQGLWQVLRMAGHGRRFLETSSYTVSILTEATDARRLSLNVRDIRRTLSSVGREIPNTMAAVTRAAPFPDPMVLGPAGKRLLPLHGIFPYSGVTAFHDAFTQLIARRREELTAVHAEVYVVYATLGSNAFLYEPVIYWQDEWLPLHRATMPAAVLANFVESRPNNEGRAAVETLRRTIVELMHSHGAAHLQIGRAYPYTLDRHPVSLRLLQQLRATLNPQQHVNPGALGLPPV